MTKLVGHAATCSRPFSSWSVPTGADGERRLHSTLDQSNAPRLRVAFKYLFAGMVLLGLLGISRPVRAQNRPANFQEFADLGISGLERYAFCPLCVEGFSASNWNNANSVEAIMDYAKASGDTSTTMPLWFRDVLQVVRDRYTSDSQFPFCAGGPNCYQNDDALWWALAFIRAYDVTGDVTYLRDAEGIFAQTSNWWGTAFQSGIDCGGGIAWQQIFAPPKPGTYPGQQGADKLHGGYDNAITNELFLETAIRLHLRLCNTDKEPWCATGAPTSSAMPNGRTYLDWAKLEFGWFEAHFMNQPGGPLIRDGLNDADNCSLTGDPITYFQGVILGGLLDMATAEREWPTHTDHNAQTYIDEATTIADAVTTQLTTNDAFCPTCGAILTEPAFGDCSNSPDCPQFKGVFMRYLGRLDQGVPKFSFTTTGRYIDFIQNNASAVWANTRACAVGAGGGTQAPGNGTDLFGTFWNAYSLELTAGTGQTSQTSAVDAFVAAIPYSASNVAVTHLSVQADNQDCAPAANAFDGNYATKWCAPGSASIGNPHWVQVQFSSPRAIYAVNVRNAATGPSGSDSGNAAWNTARFQLEYSTDGKQWSTLASTFGPNQCNTEYFASGAPVLANYLLMNITQDIQSGTDNAAARVYEIEVYERFPQHIVAPDFDGDGWADLEDNCPRVWNPGQENCNFAAEMAPNQPGQSPNPFNQAAILGDACDPVPCPNFQVVGSTQNLNCQPNPSCQGRQCTGTFLQQTFSANTIGSHPLDASVVGSGHPDNQVRVLGVATDARFCEENPPLGFDCYNPQSIADHFASDPEPPMWAPAQPWHRVMLGTDQGIFARGEPFTWQYGDFSAAETWEYQFDAAYWYSNGIQSGILAPPPLALQQTPCGGGALGRCLEGALWLHAETAVGNTATVVSNGSQLVFVGMHGQQLANQYAPIQPDKGTFSWCPMPGPGAPPTAPCGGLSPRSGVVFQQQLIAADAIANSSVGQPGLAGC